jgi:hypothetical protein
MNVLRVFFSLSLLWLEEASFPCAEAPETSDFLKEFPLEARVLTIHRKTCGKTGNLPFKKNI